MESTIRPLGGIAALRLGVANSDAAPNLSSEGVAIRLLEDRSIYSEEVSYIGAQRSVKHCLKVFTPMEYQLPAEIAEGLSCGFIALIELNSKGEVCVGWSEEAKGDRALRLVSCNGYTMERAATRGYKEWLFESVDGVAFL